MDLHRCANARHLDAAPYRTRTELDKGISGRNTTLVIILVANGYSQQTLKNGMGGGGGDNKTHPCSAKRKADLPAAGEACKATPWPSPGTHCEERQPGNMPIGVVPVDCQLQPFWLFTCFYLVPNTKLNAWPVIPERRFLIIVLVTVINLRLYVVPYCEPNNTFKGSLPCPFARFSRPNRRLCRVQLADSSPEPI